MKTTISIMVFVVLLFTCPPQAGADDNVAQKAVLVTGASTGIGRNLAERLAAEGHFVYAGARKDADIEALNAIDNIKAVRLDVTSDDDIAAAVDLIAREGRGLWGLVNNAGVATTAPMHTVEHSDLHFVFSVNVAGVVGVTKAFAPLIIESQGRIATTGSIAGTLSSRGMGVYSMSKHAIEAFTDALAKDLADTGVKVSVIEPGSYKSHIRRSAVARAMQQMEAAGVAPDEQTTKFAEDTVARELSLPEPDAVSEAYLHALFSDEPKRRYMVVPNEREARITIGKQIEELVQLNDWQAYRYSRDELVEMLDAALNR